MKKIIAGLILPFIFSMGGCSKDDHAYVGGPSGPPPPPPPSTLFTIGFWAADPIWSGDAYTYYAVGYATVSIDNGPVSTLYYVMDPAGPSSCSSTSVLKITVSPGTHTWQAYNKNTGALIRSGIFTATASCETVRIF
jgi:hypothetical protein